MFDELSGGSGGGMEPGKLARASVEALKITKGALRTLFTLMRFGRMIYLVAVLAAAIVLSGALVETVKSGTYQIRQMVISGRMNAKLEPGMWPQLFSDIVTWPKAETFFFTKDIEGGDKTDNSIEVRFNDGSLCNVSGTLRVMLPASEQQAVDLATKYGYADYKDLEQKLVLPLVRNSLRLTANFMSARESYSEKRADFVFWVWDQIQNGLYETEEETRKVVDPVSGQEVTKTFKIIRKDSGGNPIYQQNPLDGLGITMTNFEVKLFDYTEKVRAQIATQQEAMMAVATAKAKSQQAEQEALMAEAEGKANVAREKYAEEQKKIRAVVQGQQRLDVAELDKTRAIVVAAQRLEVAKLDREAAREWKQQQILIGQGDAERKRLIMRADGALKQKLDAYVRAQQLWANAYAKRQVPNFVMGGNGAGDTDKATTEFSQMMQLLVAGQMGLDLSIPKGTTGDGR